HYFDTELVIWRDADGTVACQEAFCPHLGAHLGWGGSVEGKQIRCPFHGWAFDCEGTNVEIPYADRPNRKARLRSFPVREHAGFAITRYRGLLDASLIGCSTPVDDETTHLTFLFTVKDADDEKTAKIARAFIKSVTSEVQQDIPIWEHKRYQPSPALAPSEKPI